jgi:glucose/arabinose dehydrogenase
VRTASAIFLLAALPGACLSPSEPPNDGGDPLGLEVRLAEIAQASSPVHLTAPASDPRIFVVEQAGRIRILSGGQFAAEPFLELRDRVRSGGERGLLSLAFHPDYASNGFLYVNYTDAEGDTRIDRFTVSGDPDVVDVASRLPILEVPQPFPNHNGGQLAFGPDGMLYIGMGDGGSGGDPLGNGQDLTTLLGALLRIDVDGGVPFEIPVDNPFIDSGGARPEIWAYGLRNPWRFSFDRAGTHLYVADVGQNRVEEVNVVPAGGGGFNFGWNVLEGSECFGSSNCDSTGMTPPVLEYGHGDGCSVTGGHVYRGSALPSLQGHYFYADFCQGWIRSFRFDGADAVGRRSWPLGDVGRIVSFGEDAQGELFVLVDDGSIYQLVPAETP